MKTEADELFAQLAGATIQSVGIDGDENEGGIHFKLEDGRILVIVCPLFYCLGIVAPDRKGLH